MKLPFIFHIFWDYFMELALRMHKIINKHHGLETISSNMQMLHFSLNCHLKAIHNTPKLSFKHTTETKSPKEDLYELAIWIYQNNTTKSHHNFTRHNPITIIHFCWKVYSFLLSSLNIIYCIALTYFFVGTIYLVVCIMITTFVAGHCTDHHHRYKIFS